MTASTAFVYVIFEDKIQILRSSQMAGDAHEAIEEHLDVMLSEDSFTDSM